MNVLIVILQKINNLKVSENSPTEIIDMNPGQEGYAVSWALYVVLLDDGELEWYINPNYKVYNTFGGTVMVKVKKTMKGYYEAVLPSKDSWGGHYEYEWIPRKEPYIEWFPIAVYAETLPKLAQATAI